MIEETSPGGRRGVGTIAQCVTGRLATLEEIVDWQPYDHVGWRLAVPGLGPVGGDARTSSRSMAARGCGCAGRTSAARPPMRARSGASGPRRRPRSRASAPSSPARCRWRRRDILDIRSTPRFADRDEDRRARPARRRVDGHRALLRTVGLASASHATGQRLSRLRRARRRAPAPADRPSPARRPPRGRRHGSQAGATPAIAPTRPPSCRGSSASGGPTSPIGSPGSRPSTLGSAGSSGTSRGRGPVLQVVDATGPCCDAADAVVSSEAGGVRVLLAGSSRDYSSTLMRRAV